jgi:hypothetical protein
MGSNPDYELGRHNDPPKGTFMSHQFRFGATLAGLLALGGCANEPTGSGVTEEPSFHFIPKQECVLTQGFWKNHPSALRQRTPNDGINLGNHRYSEDQLLAILRTAPKGNGLIQLARQLIAAKLNGGEFDPNIDDVVEKADDLIGNRKIPPIGSGFLHPSRTSRLIDKLTAFNEGRAGTPTCKG